MSLTLMRKMFNCPSCGPVEIGFVHGEWANLPDQVEYTDMVFEVVRPDFTTFEAAISERSSKKPNGQDVPRILADIENYAEEHRKFQCSKCNRIFVIPRKAADTSSVAGGPATLSGQPINVPVPMSGPNTIGPSFMMPAGPPATQGPNRGAIFATLDAALTEADLDAILADVGDNPLNYSCKSDKLDEILSRLY